MHLTDIYLSSMTMFLSRRRTKAKARGTARAIRHLMDASIAVQGVVHEA